MNEIQFETDKFCIHCTFFAGTYRHPSILSDDHGNCAFRVVRWRRGNVQCKKDLISTERCPITGDLKHTYKHHNCHDVRRDPNACGPEGKWFEQYIEQEKYIPALKIKGIEATEIVFDKDTAQASREAAQKRLQELRNKKSHSPGPNLSTIKADEL